MPKRNLKRFYQLDANLINARQKLRHINQLERWFKKYRRVIILEMPSTAYNEASFGDKRRRQKAEDYTWISTNDSLGGEEEFCRLIENIVFPNGAKNQSDKNDISNLLDAKRSGTTLITNDNRHILRNAHGLLAHGIRAVIPAQAVEEIRQLILLRDKFARDVAELTGCKLPNWVGKD